MIRLALALILLASPTFAATVYPLEQRIRMHEQFCFANAPQAGRLAWIASCLREEPSR